MMPEEPDFFNDFKGKKNLSSQDFLSEEESAQAKMDRERKMRQFANSGSISSAAYYGDGEGPQDGKLDNVASSALTAAG